MTYFYRCVSEGHVESVTVLSCVAQAHTHLRHLMSTFHFCCFKNPISGLTIIGCEVGLSYPGAMLGDDPPLLFRLFSGQKGGKQRDNQSTHL